MTPITLPTVPSADRRDQALRFAARGWHVFPLRPRSKKPAVPTHPAHLCDHTDPRCQPDHAGWEQRATTNSERIERAWSHRDCGVGIATGPSGLVVVDLDVPTDPDHASGLQRLADVERRHGKSLPDTFTVSTPSGGQHRYYLHPPGPQLTNTASRIGPHIDTRAAGGYVVAPPTQIPTGRYEILVDEQPPPLPDWFTALLRPDRPKPPRQPLRRYHAVPADRYVAAAVDGELERITTASAGTRNHSLFIAAVALGQLAGAGALDADHARQVLLDAANGHVADGAYSWAQAHRTIASGLNRGLAQPRQLPTNLTQEITP